MFQTLSDIFIVVAFKVSGVRCPVSCVQCSFVNVVFFFIFLVLVLYCLFIKTLNIEQTFQEKTFHQTNHFLVYVYFKWSARGWYSTRCICYDRNVINNQRWYTVNVYVKQTKRSKISTNACKQAKQKTNLKPCKIDQN